MPPVRLVMRNGGRPLSAQVLVSRGRIRKTSAKGVLLRPGMLPETVALAVKGHHFCKTTRRILAVESVKGRLEASTKGLQERVRGVVARELAARLTELRASRDRAAQKMERRYRARSPRFSV